MTKLRCQLDYIDLFLPAVYTTKVRYHTLEDQQLLLCNVATCYNHYTPTGSLHIVVCHTDITTGQGYYYYALATDRPHAVQEEEKPGTETTFLE